MSMSPILTGGEYCPDAAESERAVMDFRARNPEITRLWNNLNNGLRRSINQDFEIELPSGRTMRYRKITSIGGVTGLTVRNGKFTRTKLYGGLLTENLCQATARDVFAFHLKLLHDEGFNIMWSIHDEVVLLADEDRAEEVLARALEIMSVPPPWMPGIPLAAEGEITPIYKK
jgi:DNA polymerase